MSIHYYELRTILVSSQVNPYELPLLQRRRLGLFIIVSMNIYFKRNEKNEKFYSRFFSLRFMRF